MKGFYILFSVLIFVSCSKKKLEEKAYEPSTMNKYFEDYILNKDITVTEAKFEGRDTTGMYNGYVFKLVKGTYNDGPFEARKGGDLQTGTWQCNDDYSKLTLNITSNDTLKWISINWKFKSKTLSSLEIIPWFTSDGDRYVKFLK